MNRIEVIELRTDARYGQFLRHEPARGRVRIERQEGKVIVEIDDFLSPTIIDRLKQQAGVVTPRIDDWRAMVDCVLIDPAYDGQVFKVAVADIPESKSDFVVGRYELETTGTQDPRSRSRSSTCSGGGTGYLQCR